MATIVLTDAFVSVDGNDISSHIVDVTVDYRSELQDDTAMGLTSRRRKGGLKDWTITARAKNDWAASQVDSILFPLVGTTFTVIVRPVNTGGVSATNPNYSGTGILESYTPLGNAVGESAETTFTILASGDLSRLTS